MPIFVNDIINAQFSDSSERIFYEKTAANFSAKLITSAWIIDGHPTSGSYGSVGLANGRVCTQATSGALIFTTASNGKEVYLLEVQMSQINSSAYAGSLNVLDRISDCLVLHSSSTGAITGLDATSRLDDTTGLGDGAQIMIETQSNFSAASNSFRIQYTNQNGLTGRITPVFTTRSSSLVGNIATDRLFVPLQSGDTGVRSIQAITQSTGTATGRMAICLVKPVYDLMIASSAITNYKTTFGDLYQLPKINSNSCLMCVFGGGGTGGFAFFTEFTFLRI